MVGENIDPLSQMIGAQGAELVSLTAAIAGLRAEIFENRSLADRWREREGNTLDELKAELRNVKHDYRETQQKAIALERELGKMSEALFKLDNQITTWRAQITLITGVVGFFGIVIGTFADAIVSRVLPNIFGN